VHRHYVEEMVKATRPLLLLAVSTVLVLVLGTIGFHALEPGQGWSTAIYKAVQLFSMNSGVVDAHPTPALIEISRWLALATLIGAIYAAASAILAALKSTIHLLSIHDHAIVCGAGTRGVEIAKAYRKNTHRRVVVVEIDENNPSLGELKNLGIEVIHGNALDATLLRQAGISKAHSLVAVTGNDEKNLSICMEVADKNLNHNCELSAGVESWAWRAHYIDRIHSKKIRLDSYLVRAARNLMLDLACMAAKDPCLRRDGVRMLIDASGSTRQELLRAAILMLQISGDKKPVLEITSANPGDEAEFLDRFPASGLVAEMRWHQSSASLTFPEGTAVSPDFAVFALGSDAETLEAAERFWMRHATPDGRVVACLQGDCDAARNGIRGKAGGDFSVRNLLSCGFGTQDPLEPEIERYAKICHAVYFDNERRKNQAAQKPPYGTNNGDLPESWEELAERTKESNRLAAMHHEVKRQAWRSKGSITEIQMARHLAHCEHMRWMAFHAMDGWRCGFMLDNGGKKKDPAKLRHPSLVPYEVLDEAEKDKDLNAFLWAMELSHGELEKIFANNPEKIEEAENMLSFAKSLSCRQPAFNNPQKLN